MAIPSFKVEFDASGSVIDAQQIEAALDGLAVAKATDLLILSHGWNNDIPEAQLLYDDLLARFEEVLASAKPPAGIAGRSFAALEIFWPSKKFDDADLIPGGGAAAVTDGGTDLDAAALLAQLERFKQDPRRLGGQDVDPVRSVLVDQAKDLVATLDQQASQREFVHLLRTLVSPEAAHPEDGSDAFFTKDPVTLLNDLVLAPPAPQAGAGGGGAAGLGDALSAVGDLFSGIRAAARRVLNFTTYYQMKQRAGLVGQTGVAAVVRQVHQRFPDLRLHLAGHSFGGRLVTAAANALGPAVLPATMTLLQAAYSHNGLAANFDGKHDGFFRPVAAVPKVSGPIIITRTKNDQAVGIAYPLASRIAHDPAAALGDQNDPYGGMGRNGAQKTPEAKGNDGFLERVGFAYKFSPHKVYNLTADEFIKGHSDVAKKEVAYAMLSAIATT